MQQAYRDIKVKPPAALPRAPAGLSWACILFVSLPPPFCPKRKKKPPNQQANENFTTTHHSATRIITDPPLAADTFPISPSHSGGRLCVCSNNKKGAFWWRAGLFVVLQNDQVVPAPWAVVVLC